MVTWSRPLVVRLLFIVAFAAAAFVADAQAQVSSDKAKVFVRDLGNETLTVLKDAGASKKKQVESMRSIFNRYFAVSDIGRFVLSRYWKRATEAERKEYLQLFEDLIVYGYAKRFSSYAGENFRILSARNDRDGSVHVLSEIISPDGQSGVAVNWQVENRPGGFIIVDVVVEGVSLKLTQRSDFTAAIKQEGGKVSGLIRLLRDKTDALKADAKT